MRFQVFGPVILLVVITGFFSGRALSSSEIPFRVRSFFKKHTQDERIVTDANSARREADVYVGPNHKGPVFSDEANASLALHDWLGLEKILQSWTRLDVYAALEWANSVTLPYRKEATKQVYLAWLEQEPEIAFDWFLQFDRNFLSDNRVYEKLVELGRYDLGIIAVNAQSHRLFAADALFTAWAKKDLLSARSYLDQLPASRTSEWLLGASAVASTWAQIDLPGALEWLAKRKINDGNMRIITRDIAELLISRGNLEDVLTWVKIAPDGNASEGVYFALSRASAMDDPEQAVQWLNNVKDPDTRNLDTLLLRDIARTRPDLAATIIEQITNPKLKQIRLINLVDRWAQHDIDSAAKYIVNTTGIAYEDKKALLRKYLGSDIGL